MLWALINLSIPVWPVRIGIVGAIILNTLRVILGVLQLCLKDSFMPSGNAPVFVLFRLVVAIHPHSAPFLRCCNLILHHIAAAWRRARVLNGNSSAYLSIWHPPQFALIGCATPVSTMLDLLAIDASCWVCCHLVSVPVPGIPLALTGSPIACQCYACFRRRTSQSSCCARNSLGTLMCPIRHSVCSSQRCRFAFPPWRARFFPHPSAPAQTMAFLSALDHLHRAGSLLVLVCNMQKCTKRGRVSACSK